MTACVAIAKGWEHTSGYRAGCRCERCRNANTTRMREYRTRAGSQEARRRSRLKYQFGLAEGEYERMFEAQGGVCAACQHPETARNQYGPIPLAVDHNHSTGQVRGLLCMRCNAAAGQLQDDPERAERLAAYLRRTGSASVKPQVAGPF